MDNIVDLFDKDDNSSPKEELFQEKKPSHDVKYRIVSVMDSYNDTQDVYVTVHIKGTSKTFNKPIKELYEKKWLNEFSKEDVAYIGFLYAAEESKNLPLIEYFPRKKHSLNKNVVILGMLFACFLILSNLTAFKIVEVHLSKLLGINLQSPLSVDFPAALIFFPLTYFFDDTLTEVYGFKMSRLIIWGALLCNVIFTLGTWVTVYLPASKIWDVNTNHGAAAYELIFRGSILIFLASIFAYFCGEFLNSTILAKLKVLTSGKYFFLRVVGSTMIGVGVDSVIFCNIAFWKIMPHHIIWGIVLTQYIFKLSYEIFMLPVTYWLTNYLKRVDEIDYYDFQTRFNPFSLSLAD
jgi:uncharacterized integral membrane protein (TIGR00697 family)